MYDTKKTLLIILLAITVACICYAFFTAKEIDDRIVFKFNTQKKNIVQTSYPIKYENEKHGFSIEHPSDFKTEFKESIVNQREGEEGSVDYVTDCLYLKQDRFPFLSWEVRIEDNATWYSEENMRNSFNDPFGMTDIKNIDVDGLQGLYVYHQATQPDQENPSNVKVKYYQYFYIIKDGKLYTAYSNSVNDKGKDLYLFNNLVESFKFLTNN